MTFFLHSTPVRLSCLRQELGLTVESLANLLGEKRQTVMQWEQGLGSVPDDVWTTLESLTQAHSQAPITSDV